MRLEKVISGGQTGVDQVGLEVAYRYGWPTGGTAPKGYRTDAGPMIALLRDKYGLTESFSAQYAPRTIKNIKDADQTVWFGDTKSPGARLTIGTVRRQGKPILINPNAEMLWKILNTSYLVRALNVAGNRFRTHPEASEQARLVLDEVLRRWR